MKCRPYEHKIDRVVVEHKDRLSRFGGGLLAAYFDSHGVEIEWVQETLRRQKSRPTSEARLPSGDQADSSPEAGPSPTRWKRSVGV